MKRKRVRIFYIYIGIVILVVLIGIQTMISLSRLSDGVQSMQEITEEYIASQQAISNMREASNYLTEQAREYVINGNPENLRNYLEEVNETRRRDNALEVLQGYQTESESYQSLETAVASSNALAEVELYAMRLTAEAYGMDETELENYFQDLAPDAADAALPVEEMKAKAISLMFDENYIRQKDVIMSNSYDSLERLIGNTRDRQLASYEQTSRLLRRESNMVGMILAAILLSLVLTAALVIIPLNRSLAFIRAHKELPTGGAAEYAYLAETYNQMLEKTQEHQERLSYEASHDELTSLYNRKMFEEMRRELANTGIAMLLIDVDYFKSVNDTYGHETGDLVLKNVAQILASCFRLDDYVSRIGGDEFAVIMKHMDESLKHVVEAKIRRVRELLEATEGLPKTTLSIGVAFAEEGEHEDVYGKADLALYDIKERGRNGYAFYEPWMSDTRT